MVGGDAGFAIHGTALKKLVSGIFLQAGHKENALGAKGSEPGVVDKALVEDHGGAFGQLHGFHHTAFMGVGGADSNESRDMPVVIQQGMYLEATLGLTK